ncbi:MAG: SDR family NAD(P)-dependent oxidoreductase, partial [Patescibacteria group bacterium]
MYDLNGKIIIVTGASAGIGLATAKLLASKGAKIALVARSKDVLDELAKQLPDSFVSQADMSDPTSISKMVDDVKQHYGRIDVLVNNAGQGIYGAIENVDAEAYKRVIDLNVIGPLVAMQCVIPIMRAQGGGRIVNISSMLSRMVIPQLGAYASTKYALNALSLTARAELEKDNILVSIMLPGLTATDFGKNSIKSDAAAQSMQSRGRENMPEPDSADFVAGRILAS